MGVEKGKKEGGWQGSGPISIMSSLVARWLCVGGGEPVSFYRVFLYRVCLFLSSSFLRWLAPFVVEWYRV